jgi:DNA-binding transcriptional LysR family regulator
MEMRHLRYFVALAEHGKFRRAADRLGIAQPPLSRQIRALEREIGCGLVVRTSRGVELTAAGRVFLDQARITLTAAQCALDRARIAAPETGDTLVIGCAPSANLAIVGRALRRLVRSHPGVRVDLHATSPAGTSQALRAGVVQAAVVALPLVDAEDDLVVERIAAVPLCLAVALGHPLAGPRPVSWHRLADAPLVLFERAAAPVLYDTIAGTFQDQGLVLRPRHRARDLSSALTLVGAGLGVTVLPSGWQSPHTLGVACRPLRPPAVTVAFGIAHRRGARSLAVERFVAAARAVTVPSPGDGLRGRAHSGSEGVS